MWRRQASQQYIVATTPAHKTALIIREGIRLPESAFFVDERLREVDLGNLAGQQSTGMSGYLDTIARNNPTVETIEHARDRLLDFIRSLETSNEPTLMVAHNLLFSIMESLITDKKLELVPMLPNAILLEVPEEWLAKII